MIELARFQPEEIDEAIEGLDGLRDIIAPVLRRINGDGMGEQDVQQFIRQLTLAKHALIAMGGFLETGMKMVQTSSNAPLTLEELREMDGEPVWLHTFSAVQKKTQISCWAILECSSGANAVFLRAGVNSRLTKWFCNYGERWLAYSRKPEGGSM